MKKLLLASAIALAASTAFASPTVIDLSANPPTSSNPANAGPNSGGNDLSDGGSTFNPKSVSLAAGTYSVIEVGIAGGGLYDGYSVNTPTTPTSGSFTDSQWSVALADGTVLASRANIGRYNTAAEALAGYSALGALDFTLTTAQNVNFYVDDTKAFYFADDAGGVSLGVSSIPEPATTSLVGMAAIGLALTRRRSRASK